MTKQTNPANFVYKNANWNTAKDVFTTPMGIFAIVTVTMTNSHGVVRKELAVIKHDQSIEILPAGLSMLESQKMVEGFYQTLVLLCSQIKKEQPAENPENKSEEESEEEKSETSAE